MRIASLAAALLLVGGCTQTPAPGSTLQTTPATAETGVGPRVGMANPAAVACGDLFGGELSMIETPEGQVGMCTLPDGRVCEQWVLFQDHHCAADRDSPSIGNPVTPKPRAGSLRHQKSGAHGG